MSSTFIQRVGRPLASAILIFAAVAILGFVVFVLLFKLDAARGIDILFYRGIVLCFFAFAITLALTAYIGHVRKLASVRDAFAAACLSLGLNLSILVLAPVTFDRSISVFILGYMAAHDEQTFTTQQIEGAFRDVYVGQMQQIQRRMEEQRQSGNVVRTDTGYALSPQGLAFLRWARRIGWLFDVDTRLLDQAYGARTASNILGGNTARAGALRLGQQRNKQSYQSDAKQDE